MMHSGCHGYAHPNERHMEYSNKWALIGVVCVIRGRVYANRRFGMNYRVIDVAGLCLRLVI